MRYMNRGVVAALDEAVGGVFNMVNLPHVAVFSSSVLALYDNVDASYYKWDAIPLLLRAKAP